MEQPNVLAQTRVACGASLCSQQLGTQTQPRATARLIAKCHDPKVLSDASFRVDIRALFGLGALPPVFKRPE